MRVLVAARKSTMSELDVALPLSTPLPTPTSKSDLVRVPFDDVVRRATVIVLALPRNPQTMNLLSTSEFATMSPYTVVINIARGGIVDESAVVHALRNRQIAGYATDVFLTEPAEGAADSPLLAEDAMDLNLTVSPHLAWFAQRTMSNLGQVLKDTVEAWVSGNPINVVA